MLGYDYRNMIIVCQSGQSLSLRFSDNLPFGVLNLGSDVVDGGRRLSYKSNRFSSQRLHKYLHCNAEGIEDGIIDGVAY